MRRWLNSWVAGGIIFGFVTYAVAETITLQTYYPSPRGVYGWLRIGNGSAPPSPTARLQVTQPTGDTNLALRVDSASGTTAPLVMDSTGKVGIGTASPTGKFQVYDAAYGNFSFGGNGDLRFDGGPDYIFWLQNTGASTGRTSFASAAGTELMSVLNTGNVGIGTAGPSFPLSFGATTGNKIALYDFGSGNGYGFGIQANLLQIFSSDVNTRVGIGYGNSAGFTETLSVTGGKVGIGTTNPGEKLEINGNLKFTGNGTITAGAYGTNTLSISNTRLVFPNGATLGTWTTGSWINIGTGGDTVTLGDTVKFPGSGTWTTAGVGIGTTDPGAYKLYINGGDIYGSGNMKIQGTYTCSSGPDLSEKMPISAATMRPLEPGDVVIVDPEHDEHVALTTRAYDPMVAGIIATKPGMLLDADTTGGSVVLVGRVPTKVTTENGPIHRGDVLVTASKPGYAMRGDPQKIQIGMVIGKAMGELDDGDGTIVVLVNLQ